ncbi:MAG: hypothetical protein ACK41C_10455 [Phenylobacterium sp.]|uniref:phage tail terminator protein n=1 Tax=Phenylobacterium sp. TaxID=1871053 RepID=UPI00391AEB7D
MQGLYEAVAERIRERCPLILQVTTAMNAMETVEQMALGEDVSALVSPLSDVADPVKEASMFVSQRVTWTFGVTLALVFPAGFPEFEPACHEVKAALRGWAPAGASMPVQYRGGNLLAYTAERDGGRWLHLLRFSVPSQETYEHQS